MSKKNYDDDEDEEDEIDFYSEPFDFLKFFSDPSKLFKSKKFKHLFNEIFHKILENFPQELKNLSPEEIHKELMKNKDKFIKGPFMAGFNINFGPGGKPRIDSFGNIGSKPYSGKPEVKESREPLVEISEEEDQIIVIAEMPGVTKEEIEIKASTHSLTISTSSNKYGRKYYKNVELTSAINSDKCRAQYRNGILEIKLQKLKKDLKNIEIE